MTSFALTTFIGAFLLFQVQPLIAKYILPWFGGGPSVWTACMVFFQVVLLAGYAYAHLLSRLLKPRAQAMVHLVLIGAAFLSLPITPSAHWKPVSPDSPLWRILSLLMVSLGLPYFVLSTTGPLMQAWFRLVKPGASPYRLYALSNAGSLLALLSYPVIFERWFSRKAQAGMWGWALGAFAICGAVCAWQLFRARPDGSPSPTPEADETQPTPTAGSKFLWFALPACASVLLLAVTNTMCLDVAAVPFLWVLPLSLYLLSFVLCFDAPRWYPRRKYAYALVLAAGLLCFALFEQTMLPLFVQVAVYSGALFVCCMVCHGELYRLKPPARSLTSFYLLIASGGAVGGVFVAIIAPMVFKSYAELHWGFWLLSALLVVIHARARTFLKLGARRVPGWACAGAGAVALCVALLILSWHASLDSIRTARNFYGALRVREMFIAESLAWTRMLLHGNTVHGLQITSPKDALTPVGYYRKGSGAELAFSMFPRQSQRRIGVVGLGIGTLSVYGDKTDVVRFYEINPEVKRLAQTMFTFLAGSKAKVEIVLGDARISLENEPPQQFDLLALDAFSSDAIPIHLLTREAFALYFRHLKPDGALLVNITNRHLDLQPVVETAAGEFQMQTITVEMINTGGKQAFNDLVWMIVSRNSELMNHPLLKIASKKTKGAARRVLWTDDHSSLLQVLLPQML